MLVSYNASRRNKASWYSDKDWDAAQEVNNGALKNYFIAKVEADEYLQAWAKKRQQSDPSFQAIDLRPGALTDDPPTGQVLMGKIPPRGSVPRADVADVAVRLLERDDTNGYFDLLGGDEPTAEAIDRVVSQGLDAFEGEDSQRIYSLVK